MPVLGALPRLDGPLLHEPAPGPGAPGGARPGRRSCASGWPNWPASTATWTRLLAIARRGSRRRLAEATPATSEAPAGTRPVRRSRIGVLPATRAFTFYYPENLEALERRGRRAGADLGAGDTRLPEIDALYIGGGFPETHTEQLAANRALHGALREPAAAGLPDLRRVRRADATWPSALELAGRRGAPGGGAARQDAACTTGPRATATAVTRSTAPNPFFPVGTGAAGHEFHYSG